MAVSASVCGHYTIAIVFLKTLKISLCVLYPCWCLAALDLCKQSLMYKSLCAHFNTIGGVPFMNELFTHRICVILGVFSQALTRFSVIIGSHSSKIVYLCIGHLCCPCTEIAKIQ